jgi:hypothetical protein
MLGRVTVELFQENVKKFQTTAIGISAPAFFLTQKY